MKGAVSFIPLALLAAGCATISQNPKAAVKPTPAAVAATAPVVAKPPATVAATPAPAPHAATGAARPQAFTALERLLKKSSAPRIALNRKLLAELLQGEADYKARHDRLNAQLEALKHIDTEAPAKVTP